VRSSWHCRQSERAIIIDCTKLVTVGPAFLTAYQSGALKLIVEPLNSFQLTLSDIRLDMLKICRSMPTRREIVLLTLLLAVLLLLTQVNTNLDLQTSLRLAPKQTHTERPSNLTAPSTKFEPQLPRTHIEWGSSQVPQTRIVAHVPGMSSALSFLFPSLNLTLTIIGWTLFDNLYVLNGTMYIVSDDPQSIPERKFIYSTGLRIESGEEEIRKRLPTNKDMSIVSTEEAKKLFDTGADVVDSVTVSLDHVVLFI
jgi:hypothetical protein